MDGREYTFVFGSSDRRSLHAALSIEIEALRSAPVDAMGQRYLMYEVGERELAIALCGPLILATRRQDD